MISSFYAARVPAKPTEEDHMYASGLKLVPCLLPRLDIPVISIIDDDLTALLIEIVPYLVFEIQPDLPSEGIRLVCPFRCHVRYRTRRMYSRVQDACSLLVSLK